MKENDVKGLYPFILTRFLIILLAVTVSELLIARLSDTFILPQLTALAASNAASAAPSGTGFRAVFYFIYSVFTGQGGAYLGGAARRALLLLLSALTLCVYLLPAAVGIWVFVRTVGKRVRAIVDGIETANREYNSRRNLMISNLVHDIRTPMTTVSGYAQALSDGLVPEEERQDYLRAIVSKSQKMNDMISELFTYAKLGSDGFQFRMETFDLHELLLRCAADAFVDMENAGMEFSVDLAEGQAAAVGDAAQISRVFSNLLTNAMRHNPRGTKIVLHAHRQVGAEVVAVMDSGAFIPEGADIFDPFTKADPARSGGSGSGLGLSIVRSVLDGHGWRIRLKQPYRDGMKAFVVTVPLAEEEG